MDSPTSLSGRSDIHRSPTAKVQKHSSSLSSKSFYDSSCQSLASILNNPHSGKSDSWWTPATSLPVPEFAPLPSVSTTKLTTDVTRADFARYLGSISENYSRFHDIQQHELLEGQNSDFTGQGEALVACLREVPALYFKEDFELEEGATFEAACPFKSSTENLLLQEKLSQYLDTVELHLVKEISLRSSSFFEAQGQLEDLNRKIVEGCCRIRELKETMRILDLDLVGSARRVQELNGRRGTLFALRNKLKLIQFVNQALSTLKLLIASADCAAALDVTFDLQNLLDGDELVGMHCFRLIRNHIASSIDSINSILSAEFLRVSIHDAGNKLAAMLSRLQEMTTTSINGLEDQVEWNEEQSSNLRDRLLPIVIGLLRTARLPAVLRIYSETIKANVKTATKKTVSELLPVLVAQSSNFVPKERPVDTDGGSSLLSKFRSLSPESFLQLLGGVFIIVRAHLVQASEVKKTIDWIMSNLDGHYAANSVAAAIAVGAAAAETAPETDGHVSSLYTYSSHFNTRDNDALGSSDSSGNFRTDVLRENTEAVFAACTAAHQRWAKLLGVRSQINVKLRLQEFLCVYNVTNEFINATVKISGRSGYITRATIESQAKDFLITQHESRMVKMRALLDQENWTEIDVPDEYQSIVASLTCSESVVLHDTENELPSSKATGDLSKDGLTITENRLSNAEKHVEDSCSVVMSGDANGHVNSSRLSGPSDSTNADNDETSVGMSNDINPKQRVKSSCRTLFFKGLGYHMVNCGLILVKMLSEYTDMNNHLPALSPEIVQRVVEILKFFNTRTAQLVLGAGAMQVSGLKSITSKHLALSSQVISLTYVIIPEIRRILFLRVPETRKALLWSEIDRVAHDYKIHHDEIHSKLVQIMKERLLVHLRGLPQIIESWNKPEDTDTQPSQFARSLTKEVGFLQRVLSRTLHEFEVQAIFSQVVVIFHTQISEAFSNADINTPEAKTRLYRDVQHILGCIRSLPSGDTSKSDRLNWGPLDEFMVQRFGEEVDP